MDCREHSRGGTWLWLLLLLLRLLLSNHSQQQIPMAVKDGKASKLRPKTA